MATSFHFDHVLDFTPNQADEILRTIPAEPGVFALCGARKEDAPYLTQTADLCRRMRRLLDPPESQSKRLNLREKVARIEYCVTGSTFESSLVLYQATAAQFGYTEARRRLKLHTPYFLRMTIENAFPRVYSTNKLSKRGLAQMYGPFPSRLAAERYCDAVLDLFKLRRCYEDLAPYPDHPGCVYGEMKKCIEPCKQACTSEEYAAESAAVLAALSFVAGLFISQPLIFVSVPLTDLCFSCEGPLAAPQVARPRRPRRLGRLPRLGGAANGAPRWNACGPSSAANTS